MQRQEMIGVFEWPAMRGGKGMHRLPASVREYFSAATDTAEAAPEDIDAR